jgi:chorismate-pyruvate lyase
MSTPAKRLAGMTALALFATSGALAEPQQPHWSNAFVSRVELLALLQTLNANLLASRSATATLEKWCADHNMAAEPRLIARRVEGAEKPASPETRQHLMVGQDEPLKYRHVRLSCGDHVLSEADNWYAPGRLPEEANLLLETTDTPFGKAVQALKPFRRTIEVRILWSPLPQGWETKSSDALAEASNEIRDVSIPHEIFEHKAILYSADQKPFSEVDETYTSEIFSFEIKARP